MAPWDNDKDLATAAQVIAVGLWILTVLFGVAMATLLRGSYGL